MIVDSAVEYKFTTPLLQVHELMSAHNDSLVLVAKIKDHKDQLCHYDSQG